MIVFFLLVSTIVFAQSPDWTDSVAELKYQLDTTPVIDTMAMVEPAEEYIDEETEDTARENYFIRKEFTGGLPDTLKFRKLPDNVIKALKDDKDFWYADEAFKKRKAKDNGGYSANPVFQALLWLIIVAGFVTFLVIYLANSNTGLFRKSKKISDEEINPETSDIFSINYQAEIDKAAAAGNYRFAVRLMFLRLLRDLSDKGGIRYRQDSTNFDYMMQLHGTALYNDFFRLARHYEYSWYGQFTIDKEKYVQVKNAFDNFEQRLNR